MQRPPGTGQDGPVSSPLHSDELMQLARAMANAGLASSRHLLIGALRVESQPAPGSGPPYELFLGDFQALNRNPVHRGGYPAFALYLECAHGLATTDALVAKIDAALARIRGLDRPLPDAQPGLVLAADGSDAPGLVPRSVLANGDAFLRTDLEDLLEALFVEDDLLDLKRFFRRNEATEDIPNRLPMSASKRAALHQAAKLTYDAGLADESFFNALRAEYPRQAARIDDASRRVLRPTPDRGRQSILDACVTQTEVWRAWYSEPVIAGEFVPRPQVDEILRRFEAGERHLWLLGRGGSGKSGIALQVVRRTKTPVLALRLGGLPSDYTAIAAKLGLTPDVPGAVSRLGPDPVLVVVDQLDDASELVGGRADVLPAAKVLLQRLALIPHVRLLLVCRSDDLKRARNLRELRKEFAGPEIRVGELEIETTRLTLTRLGLDPAALSERQLSVFRDVLMLYLLGELPAERRRGFGHRLEVWDAYWDHLCARVDTPVNAAPAVPPCQETLRRICELIASRQAIALPREELDPWAGTANRLLSAGALVGPETSGPGAEWRLFHQAFFDYGWARTGLGGRQILDWLGSGEQGLFQRAQLRMALLYRREQRPDSFAGELDAILRSPSVRNHLKLVTAKVVRELDDPTSAEWRVVRALLEEPNDLAQRLGRECCWNRKPWLQRLVSERTHLEWLRGSPAQVGLARSLLRLGMIPGGDPEFVAAALEQALEAGVSEADVAMVFEDWMIHDPGPRLARVGLRVVGAVPDNLLPMVVKQLLWEPNVNTLPILLAAAPRLLALKDAQHLDPLVQGWKEVIVATPAAALLEATTSALLGISRSTAAAAAYELSLHFEANGPAGLLRSAFEGAVERSVATPALLQPILARVRGESTTERWMTVRIYTHLAQAGASIAAEAAAWLLHSGVTSESATITQELCQLVATMSPALVDDARGALEAQIQAIDNPYRRNALFSALGVNRLSAAAASQHAADVVAAPIRDTPTPEHPEVMRRYPRFESFRIGSPIPKEDAARLDDDGWLVAIAQYRLADHFARHGGAAELARVWEECARQEPARFLALARRLPADVPANYAVHLLTAMAHQSIPNELHPAIETAMFELHARYGALVERALVRVLLEHPAWDWSPPMFALLVTIIDRSADDGTEMYDSPSNYLGSHDPLMAAINSTVGEGVRAVVMLLDARATRWDALWPAIERAVSYPATPPRCIAADVIGIRWMDDRAAALALLAQLVDHDDDRLLASNPVFRLLEHALHTAPAHVDPTIERMLGSTVGEVARGGAHLAVFAMIADPPAPPVVERFHRCAEHPSPDVRRGVAEALANNLREPSFRKPGPGSPRAVLVALMNDGHEAVREAAGDWIRTGQDSAVAELPDLVAELIESAAFGSHLTMLLGALAKSPRPELVLRACQRAVEAGRAAPRASGDSKALHGLYWVPDVLAQALREQPIEAHPPWLDVLDTLCIMPTFVRVDEALVSFDR